MSGFLQFRVKGVSNFVDDIQLTSVELLEPTYNNKRH